MKKISQNSAKIQAKMNNLKGDKWAHILQKQEPSWNEENKYILL